MNPKREFIVKEMGKYDIKKTLKYNSFLKDMFQSYFIKLFDLCG